jgi:hypothetical protein
MKYLLRYLELILTAVGVVVVFLVFALFPSAYPWKPAAICAVAVAVVHGIIFYIVRSRQQEARCKEVFSIREMLDDMVSNKLDVVLYPTKEGDDWKVRAQHAVWEIQARLNFIEGDGWRARKRETMEPGV